MVTKHQTYMERVETYVQTFKDDVVGDAKDIRTIVKYALGIVDVLVASDIEYTGESVKYGVPICLLIVRARVKGIPCVTFINGLSITECRRIFLAKVDEDRLEWRKDKYA